MELGITLAVLGAALLHATWNALVKGSSDKQLDTVAVSAGAGVIAFLLIPFLPWPAQASWPWLAGSAGVDIPLFVVLSRAYLLGEVSFTFPVKRGGGAVSRGVRRGAPLRAVPPWGARG